MALTNADAVQSAQIYRQYLLKTGGGKIDIPVKSKSTDGTFFYLELAEKPRMWDSLKVEIAGTVYEYGQIYLVSYDVASRKLKVSPDDIRKTLLTTQPVGKIKLVSDLTFLVKRVEDWYQNSQNIPCIPKPFIPIPVPDLNLLQPVPEDDQTNAIVDALRKPFSYIWGPPGTGKTKMVLARCVLAYFQEHKRVLITAPTNNALEQTLNGVLPVLQSAGINFADKIIRMGIPSHEFAVEHPEICETLVLKDHLQQLDAEIATTTDQIAHIRPQADRIQEYQKYRKRDEEFREVKKVAEQLTKCLQQASADYIAADRQAAVCVAKISDAEKHLSDLQSQENDAADNLGKINSEINKIQASFLKSFRRKKLDILISKQKEQLEAYEKSKNKADEWSAKLAKLQDDLMAICHKRSDADRAFSDASKKIAVCLSPIQQLYDRIVARLKVYNFKLSVVQKPIEDYRQQLDHEGLQYADLNEDVANKILHSLAQLESRLSELQEQRNNLLAGNTINIISRCSVVAATVDTCIARLFPGDAPKFDHVFLDEAGYCSLIKGATMTAYHCPVTFLGDHMQLPPVCEMDINTIATPGNELVILWAQSALYVDEALTKPLWRVYNTFNQREEPPQEAMSIIKLSHSFRYGQRLANVLSKMVYHFGISGSPNNSTNILKIHAIRTQKDAAHSCEAEAQAIVNYVAAHHGECIGIITPFVDQRILLKEKLRNARLPNDNVFTIHGSQGREWDTVLFSVVGTPSTWFIHPATPGGLNLVNTAVSRAKNNLVVVCDVNRWEDATHHLVGKLLKLAQPI